MNKSARTLGYWTDRGYSLEDAEKMRMSRTPGTFEYFHLYKGLSKELALQAKSDYQNRRKNTLENMVKKYGDVEGNKRWESYKLKQSEKNTYEGKKSKYGWTLQEFEDFNKTRAITLPNLIKKYGEVLGREKYEQYVARQRHTTSKEYFVQQYGELKGNEKYERFSRLRKHTYESYLERFDGDSEKATTALTELYSSRKNNYNASTISSEFFTRLHDALGSDRLVYYQAFNQEYYFGLKEYGLVVVDFYDVQSNKVVEFFGDYWHANPLIYSVGQKIKYPGANEVLTESVWEKDFERIKALTTKVKDVKIVWESEYNQIPDLTIKTTMEWLLNEN
jgi:hypothetical protein